MSDEVKDLRKRIDHIDDQILLLLTSRIAISKELSDAGGDTYQDAERRANTVERLQRINASKMLDDAAITNIWNGILQETRRILSK